MTKYKSKEQLAYEKAIEKEPWVRMLDPIEYFEYMANKPENIERDKKRSKLETK